MHQLIQWVRDLKDWTIHWAGTPHAEIALFLIAFAESSFFPIPPDVLLIAMCISNPAYSLWYALICLVGTTLGGSFGYFIGLKGGMPLLKRFVKEDRIKQIHEYFEKYHEWAIGIAGFTPIPYKVFAISAGVFFIRFWKFVVITMLSRGARFFLVATLIMFFGQEIKLFIDKYFELLTLAFMVLLIGGFIAMNRIKIPQKEEPAQDAPEEEKKAENTVKGTLKPQPEGEK